MSLAKDTDWFRQNGFFLQNSMPAWEGACVRQKVNYCFFLQQREDYID